MAQIRLFGLAREVAGLASFQVAGDTVGEVMDNVKGCLGAEFGKVIPICKIWVNGEPADSLTRVEEYDEVAVLPPVSGG